ncbi:hypothetical protein GT034_15540, partial [Streptomyces sp. SID2563]|nr:hypothetical protein [Streptomyces sp. SID2563]
PDRDEWARDTAPSGPGAPDRPWDDEAAPWSALPPARDEAYDDDDAYGDEAYGDDAYGDDAYGDAPDEPRPGTPPRPRPELPQLPGGWVRGPDAPGPYDAHRYDDEDEDEDEDDGPPPRRLHLTGTWDDGPAAGRPVPAGGSREDAL